MSKLKIHIRPYQESDSDEVIALWRASKRKAFPYIEVQQTYTLADDANYFKSILVKSCDIWLAENEERLLGMMALEGDLIDQLFVSTTAQGQGVGTALLKKAIDLNPQRLRAYTFQKNRAARAFFEKHGFLIVNANLSPPPENEPDLEYAWQPGGWTTRMKPGHIRAVAVCVILNKGRIFVFESYDKIKDQTFYRPLGGGVDFGEYSEQTIRREMQEEIKAELKNLHHLKTVENIFTLDGQPGHEIVFIYEADFADQSFYERERIPFAEDDGSSQTAIWKSLKDFQDPDVPLYPDGLPELLRGR